MAADPRRSSTIPDDLRQHIAGSRDAEAGRNTSGRIGAAAGRPTYTEQDFEKLSPEEEKARMEDLVKQRKAGKEAKPAKAIALGIVTKILPCIKVFINYKPKEYFVFDLLSGISVGLFAIPQAIAFALLASLKAQNGFYSAFFAMAIYFLFGTSNHLNMTHQGAVSLIVGEAIREGVIQSYPDRICKAENDTAITTLTTEFSATQAFVNAMSTELTTESPACLDEYEARVRVSISITMVAGAVQLLMGIFRLGFLTIYLSDPLNSAFTCGAALHILSSQLANILGTTIAPISDYGKFFLYFVRALERIFADDVNPPTIFVFVGFFALLLAVKLVNERCTKYVKIPIPIDIIVLVTSLLLSLAFDWRNTLGIEDVGEIPTNFEAPRLPEAVHFTSGMSIIINGIVIGVISYSLSVSVAKTFGVRHGYEVDSNQELIAYGAVNFGMCWFSTFASASSIACTSLHESMRGKTLLYTVYCVIIMLFGIMLAAPWFGTVPKCVLAAIILVNLKNMMMQVEQLPGLWRTNKYDFMIWLVTLGAILGLDLPMGFLVGVIFSLATVIFRSQAPKAYLLGRVPKTDIYKNIKKHGVAEEIPGVKIFKFDGSLYFASAENFRTRLYRQVAMNPKKILARAQKHAKVEGRTHEADIKTEVLDAGAIKEELTRVTEEGFHPDEAARRRAQAASSDALRSRESRDNLDENDDDDEEEPTVNVFCIILDLGTCGFTDAVGIRLLKQIVVDFNNIGVEIYLSGCSSLVRSQLAKGDFFKKRNEQGVFVTVHDAVIYALSVFYKELLEDEEDSDNVPQRVEEFSFNDPTMHRKLSASSSNASERDARELRKRARKVSRMRQPDEMARRYRKASERLRQSEARARADDSIDSTNSNSDEEAPSKNSATPGEPKPLPVFDEDVNQDVENKKVFDKNIEEMLKTLPDQIDDDGADNPGFFVEDETML